MLATDAERVTGIFSCITTVWSAPLTIAITQYFLWQYLGPSSMAGLAVIALLIPIESLFSRKLKHCNVEIMEQKDKRIKMTNEVINGIKSIKVNVWEQGFYTRIKQFRAAEIAQLRTVSLISAFNAFLVAVAPFLAAMSSFTLFVVIDPENNLMTPEVGFVSLAYYNTLRRPLKEVPRLVTSLIEVFVSLKRIDRFLQADECLPEVEFIF